MAARKKKTVRRCPVKEQHVFAIPGSSLEYQPEIWMPEAEGGEHRVLSTPTTFRIEDKPEGFDATAQTRCGTGESKRCPVTLGFKEGQTTLRMCNGRTPMDVPVGGPAEAHIIGALMCASRARSGKFTRQALSRARATARRCIENPGSEGCWPAGGERVSKATLRGTGRAAPMKPFPGFSCGVGKKRPTAKQRRALPSAAFGLPKQTKYLLDTFGRAKNSKGRATQQLNKGTITQAQHKQIFKRANKAILFCKGGSTAVFDRAFRECLRSMRCSVKRGKKGKAACSSSCDAKAMRKAMRKAMKA